MAYGVFALMVMSHRRRHTAVHDDAPHLLRRSFFWPGLSHCSLSQIASQKLVHGHGIKPFWPSKRYYPPPCPPRAPTPLVRPAPCCAPPPPPFPALGGVPLTCLRGEVPRWVASFFRGGCFRGLRFCLDARQALPLCSPSICFPTHESSAPLTPNCVAFALCRLCICCSAHNASASPSS